MNTEEAIKAFNQPQTKGKNPMLSLIITLALYAVAVWLIYYIIGIITMPPPARQVVLIVFAVVCLIELIRICVGADRVSLELFNIRP